MIGFVKWYSYEKDFGFIFGEDGHEYFFRKSAGSDIPGQIVNFEPFEHSRGLRARKVSNIHNPDPQQIQKLKTLCKDFQKVEKQPMSKKDNLLMKLGSDADVVTNNDWLSEDSLNPFIYDPAYSNLSCNIFHRSNDD
ncbi:cold shock domain-containing protein [Neisseria meningitidis]|nr:cold shock domain-containing protein [Neisseria meningitidis]